MSINQFQLINRVARQSIELALERTGRSAAEVLVIQFNAPPERALIHIRVRLWGGSAFLSYCHRPRELYSNIFKVDFQENEPDQEDLNLFVVDLCELLNE